MIGVVALPGRMAEAGLPSIEGLDHPNCWVPAIGGNLAEVLALFSNTHRSLADAKERALVSPLAEAAVALLSIAEFAGRFVGCPSDVDIAAPGSMQLAASGAQFLHSLARLLRSDEAAHAAGARAALTSHGAAGALRKCMAWLAEAPSPVATASAILAEGLPALEAMAVADDATRLALAAAGGQQEWAPVAAALRRRLPRRMAKRFLPDVERVTFAVAGRDRGATMESACDEVNALMASLQP